MMNNEHDKRFTNLTDCTLHMFSKIVHIISVHMFSVFMFRFTRGWRKTWRRSHLRFREGEEITPISILTMLVAASMSNIKNDDGIESIAVSIHE